MQRHLSFIDTPEPIVGRLKASAVTFKDHKGAHGATQLPLGDATATFTVDQTSKSSAVLVRWQQESSSLVFTPAAMPW